MYSMGELDKWTYMQYLQHPKQHAGFINVKYISLFKIEAQQSGCSKAL